MPVKMPLAVFSGGTGNDTEGGDRWVFFDQTLLRDLRASVRSVFAAVAPDQQLSGKPDSCINPDLLRREMAQLKDCSRPCERTSGLHER